MLAKFNRRTMLAGGLAAACIVPFGRVLARAAEELPSIPIPPPITPGEHAAAAAGARQA